MPQCDVRYEHRRPWSTKSKRKRKAKVLSGKKSFGKSKGGKIVTVKSCRVLYEREKKSLPSEAQMGSVICWASMSAHRIGQSALPRKLLLIKNYSLTDNYSLRCLIEKVIKIFRWVWRRIELKRRASCLSFSTNWVEKMQIFMQISLSSLE